jgi:hypothetical protein
LNLFLKPVCRAAVVTALSCALCNALSSSGSAIAAECPADIESARRIQLTDANGSTSTIEAIENGFIRRTNDMRRIAEVEAKKTYSVATNTVEAYHGLLGERITVVTDQQKTVQYYRMSSADAEKLRQFMVLKDGASVSIDIDSFSFTGDAKMTIRRPPPNAKPLQRLRTELKVKGAEDVKVGACTFATKIIEMTQINTEKSFSSVTTNHYAPQLKTWLKLGIVVKQGDKPEHVGARTIVGISALP